MKTFTRILKWLLISVFSLVLLLFLLLVLDRDARVVELSEADQQSIRAQKEYPAEVDSNLYYTLLETYGKNKVLPKDFEWQCLLALSHYPELKDTRMKFVMKPVFLPLASRPDPVSVLFPWIKRTYLVVISTESADFFEPILLHNTPFNEQVGIIGHELAHSVFYQDKNSLQLARIAYRYEKDNDYQVAFERDTDKRAIAHGLGYQMYDFAFFVRKAFDDTLEEIMAEEGDMYLSPKEIEQEMAKYDFYRDTLPPPESYFEN